MRRLAPIPALLLCILFAAGCGKEEPPKPPATPPAPAPKPEPKREEPKATRPPEPAPASKEFDEAIERILTLEQDGQFAEATQLCREASTRFAAHPRAAALSEISARLRDERQAAARLAFVVPKLASPRSPATSGR